MNIYSKISNLVKRAAVTLVGKDSGQFAGAQVKWMRDKVATTEVVHPYGLSSNAPLNSLALMFNVMGQEENRAAIIYDPKNRFKNLKSGEVALGNFVTKSVIKFLENGDIEITGLNDQNIAITGDTNVTIGGNSTVAITGNNTVTVGGNSSLDVTGDADITVGGSTTIDSTGNIDITAPVVNVTGELRVTGEVTAFYALGSELSFSDIRTKYNIHYHTAQGEFANTTDPNNDF